MGHVLGENRHFVPDADPPALQQRMHLQDFFPEGSVCIALAPVHELGKGFIFPHLRRRIKECGERLEVIEFLHRGKGSKFPQFSLSLHR